jgi:hypothetical protein
MTKTFKQIASAEFQIGSGNDTVKVEGVPYEWKPEHGNSLSSQAAYAVASYIGDNNISGGKPVTLMWVTSTQG